MKLGMSSYSAQYTPMRFQLFKFNNQISSHYLNQYCWRDLWPLEKKIC